MVKWLLKQLFNDSQKYNFDILEPLFSVPLDPVKLVRANKWDLIPYSMAPKIIGMSLEQIYETFGDRSFCFYSVLSAKYVICFNDTLSRAEGIRCVAHEVGHIFLRHVSPENVWLIHAKEYEIVKMDAWANAFADYILRERYFNGKQPKKYELPRLSFRFRAN